MRVGGIVLCGGISSRMGVPKATLPFGSELMLPRVVRLLASETDPVVVVAAPNQELPALPAQVRIARDQRERRGPLEGLYAGLSELVGDVEAAYASSCDVPLLSPGFIRRMIELLGQHQIAVPQEDSFCHPLAAVYRTDVMVAMEGLLAADRLRPAFLFDLVSTRRVPVAQLKEVDAQLDSLRNLNQPEDYLAALASAGLSPSAEILRQLSAHN